MILVRTLGSAHIETGDSRITPQSLRKFALLLHLSAERGRRVPRGTLYDLIYPDLTAEKASHALRELVYQLRQSGVDVETDKGGLQLAAEVVRSDYSEVIERDRPDEAQLRAVEGGFLPGYAPSHSEAYEEWFDGWKARTTFEVVKALIKELQRAREAANRSRIELVARACLGLDPLNEEATLATAEALALSGAKARAVDMLDQYLVEVGPAANLRISATLLRKRISEHISDPYQASPPLPFVGRDVEMSAVHRAYASAKAGKSQVVVLRGEAGIGKSRIAAEFCAIARLDGAHVERIVADPANIDRPMSALIDLVPRLIAAPGALGCAPESMAILSSLTSHSSANAARPSAGADVITAAHQIERALEDVIAAICDEQPFVLLIENAHVLESATRKALLGLFARTRSVRLFNVIIVRAPDSSAETWRGCDEFMTLLDVCQFPPSVTRELVCAALQEVDGAAEDTAVVDWMATKSGGNPLFISTLASHYRATGKRYDVPMRLSELIERRVRTHSEDAKSVLHCVLQLGTYATVERILRVLDCGIQTILAAANELEDAGIVRFDGEVVRVAHPLIAEVVEKNLGSVAGGIAHERIAQVLSADAATDNSPSLLWECAHHWRAAGNKNKAHDALSSVANHLFAIGRAREAARLLVDAAGLSTSGPTRNQTLRDAVIAAFCGGEHDLVLSTVGLLTPSPDVHDDVELAELTAQSMTKQSPSDFEPRVLACLRCEEASAIHRGHVAVLAVKHADIHGLRPLAEEARRVIAAIDYSTVMPWIRDEFDLVYSASFGDQSLITEAAQRVLSSAGGAPRGRRATLLKNAGFALWKGGRANEGVSAVTQAYEEAIKSGMARSALIASLQLMEMHLDLGLLEESQRWRDAAAEVMARAPETSADMEVLCVDISAALSRRDLRKARALLNAAERAKAFESSDTRRRWRRAYYYRLRQLAKGHRLEDKELECLIDKEGSRDFMVSLRDLEMAIAVHELIACDRPMQAMDIAGDYVANRRRSRGPLTRILQDALADARRRVHATV